MEEVKKLDVEKRLEHLENLLRSLDATLIEMRMDLRKSEANFRENVKTDIKNTIYSSMGHCFLDSSLVKMSQSY